MSTEELVFGHQNPDTDAVVAAIAFAYFETKKGIPARAVALGTPNAETEYVFQHFNYDFPEIVKTVSDQTDRVMLVDHNEFQQSVADIEQVKITHVVDHHRIANFKTADPLFYRAEPVGCTSTILWEMYNEAAIEIPQDIAGLMLSAIVSDTLLLKSPTTTERDREAVTALSQLAKVDLEEYGLAMLKAGTNFGAKTPAELIDLDAKTFEMANHNVRIAQLNTVDVNDVLANQDALEKAMLDSADANNYGLFVLVVTNILTSDSEALVVGHEHMIKGFEKAFGTTLTNNRAVLPGVVSRKKQVVPPLTAAF